LNFNNIKFRKDYKRHVLVYDIKNENNEYIVIHKNGVDADIQIDLTGYELYLDTLNIYNNGAELSVIKLENYQSIIAKKM
jgi:hypothetical protein